MFFHAQPLFFQCQNKRFCQTLPPCPGGYTFCFNTEGLTWELNVGCAESVGGVYGILALQAAYTIAENFLEFG